jgi:hypothetical protein
MKLRALGLVVGAALVPVTASAQSADPADPYAPQPAPPPQTSDPYDANPPSSTTTVVTPAPQPPQPQQPVVVVNPEPRPARTTIVQPPPSYEVEQWNAPVFATGALVFAASYGASVIVASTSDHPGADRLYVPVIGPWLALNDWGNCPIEQPRCDENTTEKVLLVADGVFQAAGVITMVTGLLTPTTRTVYTSRTADTSIKVRPTRNGFAVAGWF